MTTDKKPIWTAIIFTGEDNRLLRCDVIEHEGKLWLVPEWLENPIEGWSIPARIIQLDTLNYATTSLKGAQYQLRDPIPTAILEGRDLPSPDSEYIVEERPQLRYPLRRLN